MQVKVQESTLNFPERLEPLPQKQQLFPKLRQQ
jgi:hypothetical protein